MDTIKILLVDGSDRGQPAGVLDMWRGCFEHKGMGYVEVGGLELLKDGGFTLAILSSTPALSVADIDIIASAVKSGCALIGCGPLGDEAGICTSLAEVFGVEWRGTLSGEFVPHVQKAIGFYEGGEALLFLQDEGPLPVLTAPNPKVLARVQEWNPELERYVPREHPTVVKSSYGKGNTVYCAMAVGDFSRVANPRAGEGAPGWNKKAKHSVGDPEFSSLHAAQKEFMFGLISACDIATGRVGHWPNGWRIVGSFTGDIHEDGQYVNVQSESGVDMADFLDEEGLNGLFTFSVTGRAIDEHPDLFKGLKARGYEVVPHSSYRSTWLNEISLEEQTEELRRCVEAFRKHLPPECLLGWRSHGWTGDENTERLLEENGFTWLANIIMHRFGEFGDMDVYVPDGDGTAFLPVPEKPDGLSILRLPNSYFSPDWVRTMIAQVFYGLTAGPKCDEAMLSFMKHKFHKDWRLESLHLVDWHPWEEFVHHPIFVRACTELVRMFKETEYSAVVQPTEVAKWWNFREQIKVTGVRTEGMDTFYTVNLPRNETGMNPTLRTTAAGWCVCNPKLGDRDWRFHGRGWVALPLDVEGEVEVKVTCGASQDPYVIDSTASIHEACVGRDHKLLVELEETRLRDARVALYLPKRSVVTIDGGEVKSTTGYNVFKLAKGQHSIEVEPKNRRLTAEDYRLSPEP